DQRAGTPDLRAAADAGGRGLDHVAHAALVLDGVWPDPRRGPGIVRAGARGGGAGHSHRARPDERTAQGPPFPRPRQVDAGVRDAVGVSLLLAIPDHLGGQPAGGNPVLPRWDAGGMELPEPGPHLRPLHPAVLPAAVAGSEEAAKTAG